MPNETPKVYSVAMLADRWSVSTTMIYNMIYDGRLQAFQLGAKLWRIRSQEVDRFENEGLQQGSTTPLP